MYICTNVVIKLNLQSFKAIIALCMHNKHSDLYNDKCIYIYTDVAISSN